MTGGKGSLRRKPIGAAIILAVLLILTLLPVVWMAISAVKTDREINSIPPTFLPQSFTLDNFVQLFEQFNFGLLTVNSVIVSASSWRSAWCSAGRPPTGSRAIHSGVRHSF